MKSKAEVLKNMLLRPPHHRSQNQMPVNYRKRHNQLTQPLAPLKYKLQDIPENQNPFTPIGVNQQIPFYVTRSHTGNLPVYSKFKMGRADKRTVIRHMNGDVNEFCNELKKVVSNSEITPKVGTIEIRGIHVQSVKLWLQRLGF